MVDPLHRPIADPILRIEGLGKRYGVVEALRGADLLVH